MITIWPSAGLIANCTFEPPVSTPISRSTAIEASRMIWYSLSVSVCAGATVIESPVCTPIGSRFSIEQTMMQLSLRSRTTSISNSFQPSTDSSISSSRVGEASSPRSQIATNSSRLYAIPPPVPPSVNDGLITTGKPMPACTCSASSIEWASEERGESRPIFLIASLNFSRSSALAIDKAEDREKFKLAMRKIGLDSPRSSLAHSMEEALQVQAGIGFPVVIRPSFTLGGTGGGIAYNREEFVAICERGLEASPTRELLIEESVLGWKEFEMEVVRDRNDNCIIVCSIENLDPMGVHTGDSITVAPAQTLTDKEYQIMRDASIACLREIGVETGGSNVQFAINPADGRMVVIEMNPRVSRSSALASKATGFPIAKVAAKLAVGYTLDELRNEITGGATPASFEPTIDYVVTKVPRFAFEKFPQADSRLTTQMKSVGEVMAIGRTFQESLQKALRGLETGLDGLTEQFPVPLSDENQDKLAYELRAPGANRLLYVADAFRAGWSFERIFELTHIDPWFLAQIEDLI